MANLDLRPMTLGEVLDRTFTLYKENFWLFAGIFAIPYLLVVLFSVFYSSALLVSRRGPGMAEQMLGRFLVSFAVFGLVYLLVIAAAQAATVVAVSDLYLGRAAGVGQSYARVRGRVVTVLLVMLLVIAMAAAPMLLAAILMPLLVVAKAARWLGFPLVVAVMVATVVVICRTAVAIPAATIEPVGPVGGIARSLQLTKGSAAQIFAVYVLLFVLGLLSVLIFQVPFLLAAGSPLKPHAFPLGMRILQGLASWVSGVIVAPFGMIAFSLIYYNQRVRKEAYDLEKMMASLESGESPASPSVA